MRLTFIYYVSCFLWKTVQTVLKMSVQYYIIKLWEIVSNWFPTTDFPQKREKVHSTSRQVSNLAHSVNPIPLPKKHFNPQVNYLAITWDSNFPVLFLFQSCTPSPKYSQHFCLILISFADPPLPKVLEEWLDYSRLSTWPGLRSLNHLPAPPKWEYRSANILQCFAVCNKQHRALLICNNPLLLLCVI